MRRRTCSDAPRRCNEANAQLVPAELSSLPEQHSQLQTVARLLDYFNYRNVEAITAIGIRKIHLDRSPPMPSSLAVLFHLKTISQTRC